MKSNLRKTAGQAGGSGVAVQAAPQPLPPLDTAAFDDILHFEPTKKRWNTYLLTLFLDDLPDGEHYASIISLIRPKFFTLKISKDLSPKRVLLSLNRPQVETLWERYGPFKKSFFIDYRMAFSPFGKKEAPPRK